MCLQVAFAPEQTVEPGLSQPLLQAPPAATAPTAPLKPPSPPIPALIRPSTMERTPVEIIAEGHPGDYIEMAGAAGPGEEVDQDGYIKMGPATPTSVAFEVGGSGRTTRLQQHSRRISLGGLQRTPTRKQVNTVAKMDM